MKLTEKDYAALMGYATRLDGISPTQARRFVEEVVADPGPPLLNEAKKRLDLRVRIIRRGLKGA